MNTRGFRLVALGTMVLGVVACGDGGGHVKPDPTTEDLSMPADLSVGVAKPDLAMPDLAPVVDLSVVDTKPPEPDLQPDLSNPDLLQVIAANATCANAQVVMGGQTIVVDTHSAVDDLHLLCRSGARGPVLYYTATLAPWQKLTTTVTPLANNIDPVIRILDSCTATTCSSFFDNTAEGVAEPMTYTNMSATPKTILFAVSAYNELTPGKLSIAIAIDQQPIPPTNAQCVTPMVITDGQILTDQDSSIGVETQTTACESGSTGKVLYYQATVPAGLRLRAKVDAQTAWDPALRVLPGCGVTSCLADSNASSSTTENVVWLNTKMTAQTVLLAVGAVNVTTQGKFKLEVHIEPVPPPPSNSSCAAAMPLAGPATVTMQDPALGNTVTGTNCSGTSGKNLFYSINVPAGNTLKVVINPAGFDAVIRLILGTCPSSGCIVSQDSGISGPETLLWKNANATDQKVVIGMGPYSGTGAQFDATIDLIAPPVNVACATPTPIMNGTMIANEDATQATTALDAACIGNAKGKALFYSVTIPPGQTLTATATPTTNWDPVIRVIDSCAATTCIATADGFATGVPEVLTYMNSGTDPQNLLVAVGSYVVGTTGKFNLAVRIQ